MSTLGTTRTSPPLEVAHERRITRQWGNRYRCTTCYARGIDREPHYMCHHCGRLFCEECDPKMRGFGALLFQHPELSGLRARGARRWIGDIWWQEAEHCNECVHYVPRYRMWGVMMLVVAALTALLLYAAGASPAMVTVIPALLFVAGMGVAVAWRTMDVGLRQHRFFPVDGEPPVVELEERIEADAVLDKGSYMETLRERSPRGILKATVRITEEDRRQLLAYEQQHHLQETVVAKLPVTAGAVVMEHVERVMHPTMRWNERGDWLSHPDMPSWNNQRSRRWEFNAPLEQWSALWVPDNDEAKTFVYDYLVDWWIWRQTFRMAFPVQIRASFPEQGERRTVVLEVALTNSVSHFRNPYISQITVQRGEGLPVFQLLPVQGQKMEGDSPDRVAVQDLKLNENRVGMLQLQFDAPLDTSEPIWLEGVVRMGAVGGTFSKMEIKGYYDAYGRLSRPARQETRSAAILHFRLNLATLPYQTRTMVMREATLTGANTDRDDTIIEVLSRETEVVYSNEQVQVQVQAWNAPPKVPLPPIREIVGRWHTRSLAVPVVYRVKLTPTPTETTVHIEVEQTDDGTVPQRQLLEQAAQELRKLIVGGKPPTLLGKLNRKS